jgi:PAS domain S-box-containing protein
MKETLANQLDSLRTTLGKMEIALNRVSEAIVSTDSQGRVEWCNTNFIRLLEKSSSLIMGRQLSELLPLKRSGQNVTLAEHPVNLVLKGEMGERVCYEFQNLILEISWSYLKQQNLGDRHRVILTIQDITESKSKEQALQHINEELERRVAQRTQALTLANQQLEQELTERRRMEAELRTTTSRLSALIQNLQAGVLVENELGQIVLANQRLCNKFRIPLSPEQLVGLDSQQAAQSAKELFVDSEHFVQRIQEILKHRQIVTQEELLLRDGRTFERDYVPIWIEGNYYGHLWMYRNISDRKQVEENLRLSQERLQLALDTVEAKLWDWNLVTGKFAPNPCWATMLGYSHDEVEDSIDLRNRLVHSEDKPYMMELLQAHLSGQTPYFEAEVRMQSKSGEWKWILDRGQVIERDEQGKPLRMLGIHKDITQRKRAEETLRKQYQQILLLKEIVEEIRQSLDIQKIFQTTTERVGQALGVDRAIIYSYIEHPAPQLLCVTEYLTSGTSSMFALSVPNASDAYAQQVLSQDNAIVSDDIFAEVSLEPLWPICRQLNIKSILAIRISDRGKPNGVLVLHQCNSVRHWEEDEVKWLEAVAAQVGIALAQAQLLEQEKSNRKQLAQQNQELNSAKKAAEAANRAKSEFLATMSHEIRTPMNSVIGMAGLLLDTNLTSEQQNFAETIRSSGEALLVILNDILDFSKIESGKLDLEEYPFEVQLCVEEALDLILPRAIAKNLKVDYKIDPQVPVALMGDITRVRQILVNLLSNAVKFTDAGEISLVVTASPLNITEQTYSIQFMLKDTGIGITPEQQKFLFQSFSQANASINRKYGGTGLGLAICKRLAEMMGGSIWAESHGTIAGTSPLDWLPSKVKQDAISTKGATFYFTIAATAVPLSSTLALSDCQAQLKGKRILIVDDNPLNREFLTQLISSWGMIPCASDSGLEALCWLRQGESFDLAILEQQILKIEGIELAEAIHALPEYQNLPLVMLTSVKVSAKKWQKKSQVHFAAWLQSPVKKSQLYDTLVRIFWQQSASNTSDDSNKKIEVSIPKPFPLRILLAEDNSINQQVALLILQKLGYRADVVSNGLEAIRALHQAHYDVVLMDVEMPEMDGLTATRHISEEWMQPMRPWIIALTAYAMKGDREKCLAMGMNDYITKPIRKEELLQALHKAALHLGKDTASNQPTLPQTPHPEDSVLDLKILEYIREMAGKEADRFIPHLIQEYLKTAPQYLEKIQEAIASSNLETLRHS